MKKSNAIFTTPQRESPWAILFILGKSIYQIFTRIWPALLVVFLNLDTKKGYPNYLLTTVIVVAIIAMAISLINYFKTYYFIKDNELIISKGVLRKLRINIPFDRIQSVQVQQNIIHSLCRVVQLKIDTAGSEKSEVDFFAIESWKANELREIILSGKMENEIKSSGGHLEKADGEGVFLRLGMYDLLKVGITRNHLKSGGVIIVFFVWLYDNLNEIGIDTENYYQNWIDSSFSNAVILYLFLLFFLISVGISLVRSIIMFYGLILERVPGGFRVVSGLFTRKEMAARDIKIQLISWSDNRLKKMLGYFDLKMTQAGVVAVSNKQKISVPGAKLQMIDDVVNQIFKFSIPDQKNAKKIHASFFWRYFWILSFLFVLSFSLFWFLNLRIYAMVIPSFLLLLVLIRFLRFRRLSYVVNEKLCVVWGGAFGEKNDIFPLYKIQGISWSQSPFQRRKKLVSLRFYLASGHVDIPYLPWEDGMNILNTGLFVSESTHKKWM